MRFLAWKQIVWLLTLAGIVRMGAAAYWDGHWHGQFVFGDSRSYFELARTIAHGQPYQLPSGEQVFRAPGYPLLLSPVLWFLDGPQAITAARIESCLFGSLTVLAVAFWAAQIFGPRAAWIAGLITALYPEAVAVSVPVLSEAPFCLLVAMNMAIWTAAWRSGEGSGEQGTESREQETRNSVSHAARPAPHDSSYVPYALALLAGATAGAATLVRPSWILFLPFAFLCGMIYGPRRKQTRLAAAMLIGFVAIMSPWWVRNYRVTGHFVPTTLQVGASLYDGWNPRATGASDMRFVPEFEAAQRKSDAIEREKDGFEYRLDRRFRQAAWGWACANPGRVFQLAAVKFLRFWNVWPNEPTFSAWPVRLAVLASYVPLLLLAALALRRFQLGWAGTMYSWSALCWLPAVYFTLLHTVFVSSIRYRQPALLGLIVLAAGCLAHPKTERLPFSPSA